MPREFRSLLIAVISAPLLISGCDWLRPGGPPEEAFIEVSSTNANKATLVTSRSFVWAEDPECAGEPGCGTEVNVLMADTTTIDLPYSVTLKFTSTQQLLTEVFPAAEVEAWISLRIAIDGTEKYTNFKSLSPPAEDGSRETMLYVYQFGGRPLDTGGVGGGG